MAKAIISYESKYGNTKHAAEIIVEGMNQVSGTEVILTELNNVDLTQIGEFDIVLVGSPNHMGRATRNIRKFIGGVKWLKRLINQEKRRKTQVSIQLLVHAVVIPARNEL